MGCPGCLFWRAYKDAAVERISLQPGRGARPPSIPRRSTTRCFLITAGKGYIATPAACSTSRRSLCLCPTLTREQFTFHCAADAKECMEIVHFVTELNDYDKTCLKEAHLTLPRFQGVSQAWHYKEDFTGADISR